MKLYLVQHGEAGAKNAAPERPLTDQGREDIDRLAASLERAGIRVERVIHSGKLHAVQTAERLAEAIAPVVELDTSGVEYAVSSIEQRKAGSAPRKPDKSLRIIRHGVVVEQHTIRTAATQHVMKC